MGDVLPAAATVPAAPVAEPARVQPSGWPTMDVVFGIVAPPTLVLFDPGLFTLNGWMLPGSAECFGWKVWLWTSILVGVPALACALWLLQPPGRGPAVARALLRGVLFGAAVWAAAIGSRILPLSLMLALAVIGLLGLVPFATAWILFRNARRLGPPLSSGSARLGWVSVGFVLAVGLPLAADAAVSATTQRALEQVTGNDAGARARALQTLDRLKGFVSYADVHTRWARETDPTRKARLAEVFERVSDIPPHLWGRAD